MVSYPARRRTVSEMSVLGVASFGGFLAFLDATIVNVAIPDIGRSFPDAGLDGISWVLNAYNIVFAAFLVVAGRLVDLLGRKRLFEIGIGVFTLGSLFCGIAPSLEGLVAARMLQAIGAAIIVPASLALVIHAFAGERRSHGVALWTAIAALAAGLGPATGGALIEIADWRWCFLINLPIGIAAFLLSGRALVESRAPGRRKVPDLFGALLLAVAIGALTLGIIKTDAHSVTDPVVFGPIVASAALLYLFGRRCASHRAPVINLALLRIRTFSAANVLTIVAGAGFYSYILCNVLFLTAVWRYSALEAGLALTPGPFVAAAIAGPLGRRLIGRDPRVVLLPGALVWAAGLLYMITQVGARPEFVKEWLPGMVILGVGAGATFPTLGGISVSAAPGRAYATSTALNSVSRQLGATIGIALLVSILGQPGPAEALAAFDNGWTLGMVCFAIVAIGVAGLGRVPAEDPVFEDERSFDAAAFRLSAEPTAPAAIAPLLEPRADANDVEAFLAGVEVFQNLEGARLAEIARGAKDRLLPGGETLFEAGDPADTLFIVRSGRIDVIGADGELYRELGPGDVLGELAVLSGMDRAAAARARRDSLLLELPWAHVGALLESDAAFSKAMITVLARQLRASRPRRGSSQRSPPLPRLVATVALHPGFDVDEFAAQLGRELSQCRRAIVVRDEGRPANERGPWIEAIEREHDVVVLSGGDDPDSEWANFCSRQADRVLALISTGPPLSYEPPAALCGCDLVCCGEFADGELSPWFPMLEARTSHRVPEDSGRAAAIAVIARRLSGMSIGLVLSGGGARGLAHIGVLDVLDQAGIVIDRVAGTSIGAYIGGLYAAGRAPDEIDSICYEEWVRRNPLNDYRVPRTSLIRGEKARAMYMRVFDGDIERMPRSFFCCAVDMVSGDLVVQRYGSAAFAVASSMLLPALAPPSATGGGRLLVDGGLRNNLPIDIMAAHREGPIIAVDVGGTAVMELNHFEPDEPRPNGATGEVLAWAEDRRIVPPGIGELLVRAVTLGSADGAANAERYAAVVIRPENDGVGMFEFHMLDEMRAAGRRAAREALSG